MSEQDERALLAIRRALADPRVDSMTINIDREGEARLLVILNDLTPTERRRVVVRLVN